MTTEREGDARQSNVSRDQDPEFSLDSQNLSTQSLVRKPEEDSNEAYRQRGLLVRLTALLSKWGVETEGATPIPIEKRTNPRIYQMFWIWFSANFNILAFGTGSTGPAFFGLGLKNSFSVLLVVDIMHAFFFYFIVTRTDPVLPSTCSVPAFFAVFGPKLGMRSMVQCRFSWGRYGAVIPSILNVVSTQGFLILNCIIGGQILAAASSKLDATLGIVITSMISLVVTIFGYHVIHWFESFAWVPAFITFPILLGVANKHLDPSSMPSVPTPSVSMVLSFASFISSSIISWCTITPDYGVYHDSEASSFKIFLYSYLGFLLPNVTWQTMGAAFAAAAPGIPSWKAAYDDGNDLGGLLRAVLSPTGGFGTFLLVIVALGTSCASAPSMYTFGTSLMAINPTFARIPRYGYAIISEIILIPLAIIGAKKFCSTLVDVLSTTGYWASSFGAIVLTEHFLFRRSFQAYDIQQWDNFRLLPPGIAAILAFLGSFAIIIPSIQQTWYTGPIAKAGTGNIGIFTGAIVAFLLYAPLRALEKKLWPGREIVSLL